MNFVLAGLTNDVSLLASPGVFLALYTNDGAYLWEKGIVGSIGYGVVKFNSNGDKVAAIRVEDELHIFDAATGALSSTFDITLGGINWIYYQKSVLFDSSDELIISRGDKTALYGQIFRIDITG
eukprot:CAMPEP_0170560364 /NCGR_PEP_ID=MMETSP0211-20121228/48510_1 /TAXON_ID=311385 /ORGANISM="Pseudokeronopsis sp., Strain OXSARD2" /LENGTH=123 /DNA_ID=CAMNT_0010874459 /DNA_START=90 /DNA_END=461 /DNA_ORIENTATION=-